MELLNVLIATAAAFGLGAVWYGKLAEPWMEAAGIERDESGQPKGGHNPMIYAGTFAMQLLVAGMMRHTFSASGIVSLGGGLIAGIGIGLFFISPWIVINNLYGGRPLKLSAIDGGYAVLACAVMGLVLNLF